MKMTFRGRARLATSGSSGFSLIELAVALAVLGVIAVLLVRFLGTQAADQRQRVEHSLLVRADQALTGFALAHHRLPCPDGDGDGREDCGDHRQVGWLPFRDLGLPDLRAGRLRYGVLRRPGAGTLAAVDLAAARDRYFPLLVQSLPPTAGTLPLGNVNNLDLCQETRVAAALPQDPGITVDYLHTTAGDGTVRAVAFALAAPGAGDADGDGGPFDGANAGLGAVFTAPQAAAVHGSDDRVLAVAPGQLWSRLQCGEAMSAAGHAHPNVANAAMILAQGAIDYAVLADLAVSLAEAKVDSAIASALTAGASLTMAGVTSALAIAQTLLSAGAMAPVVAAAALAIAANTAALASAIAARVFAENALDEAQVMRTRANNYRDQVRPIAEGILQRARQADLLGLH